MKYTVRYAHLKELPKYKPGDIVKRGDTLGIVGNTGQSHGEHLHIDLVEDWQNHNWRVKDLETGLFTTNVRELREYFIDKELFGGKDFKISQYFFEPKYERVIKQRHWGFDLILTGKEKPYIYWNRSFDGIVSSVGRDDGYGYYIMVNYKV